MNSHLVSLFKNLSDNAYLNKDMYRAAAFDKAAYVISQLKYAVNKTTLNRLKSKKHPGIGDGIMDRIEEYVLTGKIAGANPIGFELADMTGVGPATLAAWSKLGIHNRTTLQKRVDEGSIKLTTSQLFGLKYYDDLHKRLDRTLVKKVADEIRECVMKVDSQSSFDIVGSYRRGLPTSGDVDLIVSQIDADDLMKCVTAKANFVGELSRGSSRIIFLWREGHVLQVDILIASDYYAALNYFTGSDKHNIELRIAAKLAGLRLSQNGLFVLHDGKNVGDKIILTSEEDIYRRIGVDYVEPKDR